MNKKIICEGIKTNNIFVEKILDLFVMIFINDKAFQKEL